MDIRGDNRLCLARMLRLPMLVGRFLRVPRPMEYQTRCSGTRSAEHAESDAGKRVNHPQGGTPWPYIKSRPLLDVSALVKIRRPFIAEALLFRCTPASVPLQLRLQIAGRRVRLQIGDCRENQPFRNLLPSPPSTGLGIRDSYGWKLDNKPKERI